jgi:acyl-[acyl-carrier-protein]-phospholipid O-acyltransferase/long-chain-fatty-acid--[acyl-carrier-protein] ligase
MAESSSSSSSDNVNGAGSLRSRGFLCLLATHFLVLVNDNMFRWLVVGLGKEIVGPEAEGFVVSAGFGCLILPYILFAAPAGYLADRFSKRSVLVGCKVAEFGVMALGAATAWSGNVYLMLTAIALAGTIAALYGAAKLGIIPEIVHSTQISSANGIMGLTTVIAVSVGTVAGNALGGWAQTAMSQSLSVATIALLIISALGILVSMGITHVPAGNPLRKFPLNPFAQTYSDMRLLASNRSLLYVTLGSSIFWTLAGVAHLNVDYYVERKLELTQFWVGPLLGVLTVGVGIGSVLAGVWSRGKVELGITPLGALGIAMSAVMLFIVPNPPADPTGVWTAALISTCFWLFLLGISSGLYDVPLAAYIQDRSPPAARGSIISAFNFMTFTGMLFAAGAFWVMRDVLQISAPMIFLIKGLLTLGVAVYAICLIPRATIRFVIWLVTRLFYRVRIEGLQNLPDTGPALLVSNHISWLDGVMLITMTSRPIRFVGYAPYTRVWYLSWLARIFSVIPVDVSPSSAKGAVKAVRQALADGELVCIFPEGGISRTGQIQTFKPGMMLMLKGSEAPIIPVYLDELWGSIFSFRGGKFLWKFPRHWPYPVSIYLGSPLREPKDVAEVRSAVEALGVEAMQSRQRPMLIPPRAFLRQCRHARRRSKIADSTGADMTGGRVLMSTLIFRRLLNRILAKDERFVGVLLPPSAGGVLANAALTVDQRVAVNLNYTMTAETINYCIAQCGIRHVLASRKMMEKLDLKLDAELIYLEDLREKMSSADKIAGVLQAYLMPIWWLERRLGLTKVSRDDLMTVIFTSGSTGKPKGVMLSFNNIAHNIAAIDQVVHLTERDVLCGVLPFFHSLGYTVTLWAVLGLELKGTYHFTPLEPRQVGKLCKDHGVTIMLTTPTFLRSYLRRCEKEDFAKLEVVVCGAEKLPAELTEAFDQKFGVRPVEGYGTTELAPLVSVNIPPSRAFDSEQIGLKEGTVGRPVPGVAAKIVHLETGEALGVDEPGMLLIKGPNVMLGYLHQPEKTAEVIRDGWYVTGDVALLDADGFIRITGRQSRFSKIGGEMVPHGHVEELLQQVVGGDSEHVTLAVTAVPDARKGERLVVLYTQLNRSADEICRELATKGLPNLWIPSPDSFFQVEAIPVLGTGKMDLQKVKQLAAEKALVV